jgi:hypothetical protein
MPAWLCKILRCDKQPKPKQPGRFDWKIGLPTTKTKTTMIKITITNEQKVTVTLAPVTATGKPATLDGAPVWTVQSGDSTVLAADGGLSASLISSDTPGDTVILVEADADLGAGVETISDIIQLTVQGARAQNLGLTVGTPEPK